EYFRNQKPQDFKNSKQFWQFFSSRIKVRSDNNSNEGVSNITVDNEPIDDKSKVSEIFNCFFTSNKGIKLNESIEQVNKQMKKMIKEQNLKIPGFKFSLTNGAELERLTNDLANSSNPGSCVIPVKFLKNASKKLFSTIAYLFNCCIIQNSIPNEWKKAVVTPLFKKKGSNDEINNYRAISILPPISKLFEKLISKQLKNYFEKNKLFSDSQHEFRSSHSFETALHEIISQMNKIKSKRLIGLFLFIDFKKAFDSVESKLLLLKLKYYGFNESAVKLIDNYFLNRSQVVKIDETVSGERSIQLGGPQGSVLGPLLFLIFINDIVFSLNDFIVKLFADDTTLISIDNDLPDLLAIKNFLIIKTSCDKNFKIINTLKMLTNQVNRNNRPGFQPGVLPQPTNTTTTDTTKPGNQLGVLPQPTNTTTKDTTKADPLEQLNKLEQKSNQLSSNDQDLIKEIISLQKTLLDQAKKSDPAKNDLKIQTLERELNNQQAKINSLSEQLKETERKLAEKTKENQNLLKNYAEFEEKVFKNFEIVQEQFEKFEKLDPDNLNNLLDNTINSIQDEFDGKIQKLEDTSYDSVRNLKLEIANVKEFLSNSIAERFAQVEKDIEAKEKEAKEFTENKLETLEQKFNDILEDDRKKLEINFDDVNTKVREDKEAINNLESKTDILNSQMDKNFVDMKKNIEEFYKKINDKIEKNGLRLSKEFDKVKRDMLNDLKLLRNESLNTRNLVGMRARAD
ncbi:unnamed protein product, partial [Brachionus calyciflorus]